MYLFFFNPSFLFFFKNINSVSNQHVFVFFLFKFWLKPNNFFIKKLFLIPSFFKLNLIKKSNLVLSYSSFFNSNLFLISPNSHLFHNFTRLFQFYNFFHNFFYIKYFFFLKFKTSSLFLFSNIKLYFFKNKNLLYI